MIFQELELTEEEKLLIKEHKGSALYRAYVKLLKREYMRLSTTPPGGEPHETYIWKGRLLGIQTCANVIDVASNRSVEDLFGKESQSPT